MMIAITVGVVCVLIIVLIGYYFWSRPTASNTTHVSASTPIVGSESKSIPIPSDVDLLALQNQALATSQPQEDQALRANTVIETQVRGYTMPTSRDEQLQMMSGEWASSGIRYIFENIDIIQDTFTVTKITNTTTTSLKYVSSGWNNNVLLTRGSNNQNATFVYEGSSMVIQTNGLNILLIRR